jgi:hypothetical protein
MEKKYTFLQKLRASIVGVNVNWLYATRLEKSLMHFNVLSELDKKKFLKTISEDIQIIKK